MSGSALPGRRARALVAAALLLACGSVPAPEPPLRIGTSGDYAPFSTITADGERAGLDIALGQAFAASQGRALEWVPFRWPELLADLEAERFDVAMSGITVRPERSVAGRFTPPVTESGAVALVRADAPPSRAAELDRPGTRIAVNAGGHLERVTRARFSAAVIEAVPDNARVMERLLSGQADAAVTDTLEAPHWKAWASERGLSTRQIGPFTRDEKAWLVRADRPGLARALATFLLAEEASGRLQASRASAAAGDRKTATPLAALEAAVDERLELMPLVAEAKRGTGVPVFVPTREQAVLDAAWERITTAAAAAGQPLPPRAAADGFFRAQIAAAREIQQAVLAEAAASSEAFSLDQELRPALIRIGDRIAWLLVEAGAATDPGELRTWGTGIEVRGLSDASRDGIRLALERIVDPAAP